MASGDIKGFYKQKKKGAGGISKPSAAASRKKRGGKASATLDAGPAQTPALDLNDEYGEEEEKLRQFDMNMGFGPCIGLSRMARWERASAMGLNPPADVGDILARCSSSASGTNKPGLECLWEGRV